ncbi:MAG: MFS transporter [Deinococcales bacterium]
MASSSLSQRLSLGGIALIGLLVISHSSNDALAGLLAPLLPSLEARFNLDKTALAALASTLSLFSNVLQPLFGSLVDRFGQRIVATLGLLSVSVFMSLIGIAPNIPIIILLLILGGLGSAAFHPAASSLVRQASHSVSNKAFVFGFFTSAGPLGQALSPLIVLWIVRSYGLQGTPLMMALGVILALVIYFNVPKRVNTAKKHGKLFDLSLLWGPVGLLALVGILRSIAFVTFINAMPLWVVAHGYARDAFEVGLPLSIYSAFSALGVLLGGAIEPRLGRRRLIVGAILLALPFTLAILLAPVHSLIFYTLIAFSSVLTNAPIASLVVSAQDFAPHAIGTASGMMMGMTWGLAGVLYIILGSLQET